MDEKDKELLRLAAKAFGVKVVFGPDGVPRETTDTDPAMNLFAMPIWNPLLDSGQALVLAARLYMEISFHLAYPRSNCPPENRQIEAQANLETKGGKFWAGALVRDDEAAAMRRAIVTAAAQSEKAQTLGE